MIEGFECKCGYKTISKNTDCPRCGRIMIPRKFFDEGKVLSFVKLGVLPENHTELMNLAMVEIDDGPKIVCWADASLKMEQRVRVFKSDGILQCSPP